MNAATQTPTGPIAVNRKARLHYTILEKMETGIALLGTEVKSVRARQVDLAAAFAAIHNGQVYLRDAHIKPYEFGHQFNHEPRRPRRLLLHRREIDKLAGKLAQKRLTLIPLALYFKHGRIKVELALCQGKQHGDKRETLRRKTADRETQRAITARQQH